MSNNNSSNQSNSDSRVSSLPNNAQFGKIKEGSSRVRRVDPKDTKFERFDGNPPESN